MAVVTAAGFALPGGESTSAQLRRVSQERTQLAVALREEKTARAATQQDLSRVERERDELQTMTVTLTGALLAVRAELASARQEIALLKAGGAR